MQTQYEEVINYIVFEARSGTTHNEIKDVLLKSGWSATAIDDAFSYTLDHGWIQPEKTHTDTKILKTTLLFFAFICIPLLAFGYSKLEKEVRTYVLTDTSTTTSFIYGPRPELSKPNFFLSTKNELLAQQADFIEANLETMTLTVFQKGTSTLEVPILAKGRPGAWWETPAGLYAIETKEIDHFSGLGHVHMPYSMQFQGNFYIHGWPYYPDGTPVASTYSGGCIRLDDINAKKVFSKAHIGMPVLVYENDTVTDSFTYTPPLPDTLTTEYYLVADVKNNHVFASSNATTSVPIASITKLLTALVITEHVSLDARVTIREHMLATTSIARLEVGKTVSAYELLRLLLLESSNEAGEALASILGRTKFISLMNKKANAIGMHDAHFVDPTGMSDKNTATLEDLFILAQHLYGNRNFLLKVSSDTLSYSPYETPLFPKLKNFNSIENDPDFIGGKIGQTIAAKETMLALFNISVEETDRPIAILVLQSDNNMSDVALLKAYVEEMIN